MSYRGLGWISTAVTAAATAYQAYSQSSAGGCWTGYNKLATKPPCPNMPNMDAVVRAVERAPDSEIQKIIAVLLATNSGRGPKSRADLLRPECVYNWVMAMQGGGDCVASKVPEQPQMLYDLVATYGAPATEADLIPGSAIEGARDFVGSRQGAATLAAAALVALFFIPAVRGK